MLKGYAFIFPIIQITEHPSTQGSSQGSYLKGTNAFRKLLHRVKMKYSKYAAI